MPCFAARHFCAYERIRTSTPEGTTPSRWRVYQFHHIRDYLGVCKGRKRFLFLTIMMVINSFSFGLFPETWYINRENGFAQCVSADFVVTVSSLF